MLKNDEPMMKNANPMMIRDDGHKTGYPWRLPPESPPA